MSKKHPLEDIFKQIDEERRSQYSLGYTPEAGGSGYRKIHVTVKPKGLVVQARDGYSAGAWRGPLSVPRWPPDCYTD